FKLPLILKSNRMGYDGKGQVLITEGMSAQEAWSQMGSEEGVVEAFVDFACEISVIVARREDGEMAAFPPVQNVHQNHILSKTIAPAPIDADVAREAEELARILAEKLDVVGLLAVEMFVLKKANEQGQRVLVNEIAPRPHNSGHWTMDACACSQYEQLVRAICGLPLGDPTPHSRAEMHNLLGQDVARATELMAQPSACVHLYGKQEVREGRKMGHVTFLKEEW
ncbi:MAG TPA: 5-(carboxyamino)imidazole ribonucleotide synthase, partial [Rhodospirillaceae bacterium]|nr:5-(carboxyamino)imidazole ribonucleotide synthase [Rhodospirillaceae bacterium]